jgi:hypothetical protein
VKSVGQDTLMVLKICYNVMTLFWLFCGLYDEPNESKGRIIPHGQPEY